jgi:hypothetical protein
VKIAAFLLNAAIVLAILDLIARMDVTEGWEKKFVILSYMISCKALLDAPVM